MIALRLSVKRYGINARKTAKRIGHASALILEAVKAVVQHSNATEIAYQTYHAVLHSEFGEQEYQNIKRKLSDLTSEEIATAKAQIQGIAANANSAVYETLLRELALKRTDLQRRLEEFETARAAIQSLSDRATMNQEALADVDALLSAPESMLSNTEKNQMLARIIESIYPDETGEQFTITFRGFDTTQLIAEVKKASFPPYR